MPWNKNPNTAPYYKSMKYASSCFPCSLHVVLKNLKSNTQIDDSIEDLLNNLQIKDGVSGLDAQAPDENAVHRLVAQPPLNGAGCSIITPTMLRNIDAESFQQQAQSMFNDYKGMVIGIGHATVIYKTATSYVHIQTSRKITNTYIETDDQINISVVPGDVNKYAVRIQGHTNKHFGGTGNFIMLLR